MVGIFSGRLLGLTGGSGDVLGGSGLLGSGSLGRGGEQVYVNATTGNLVLSKQDEFLVGKGPDASVSRTYNSLTTLADDNGDDWRQSTDRRVYGLTGTLNTAGSTVRRVSGDGTEVVYTWSASWRNGSGAYVATDGSGAYDTIVKSGAEWVWYDGDTSARESYYDETAAAGLQGKIKTLKDAAGLAIAYAYDSSNRLSTITTASGESIQYTWAGNNIIQVSTSYTRSAIEETYTQQLYRLYDAAFGRIPDAEGFSSYINFLLSGGKSLSAIADEFYSSSEYQGRGVGSMSNTQFVDFLYNSVLRRAADSNGLSTYVAALDAGQSRGQMLLILSESAEHQTYMTDRGLTAPAKSNTIKTYYSYDSNGRLSVVTTDLTPIGGTLGDDASYATAYGYDAAGHVTSIAQSDGSQLIIEYESTSATARVTKLTETASSGVTRVTGFAYAASTLFSGGVMSSITDPSGQVTVLETDGAGNLRRITAPLIAGAAARQLTQFTYTANGDLASVIDYAGKVTSYGNYTVDGQARTITDTLGNVVTRVFGSIDRTTGAATAYSDAMPYVATDDGSFITDVLLSETSKGVDQSGASINEVTRYAYDKYGGLRYTISPEGRVTEQVRSSGVVITEVEYPEALYTAAGWPSEADLNAWRDALPDRSSVVKVNYGYDARFNIRQITTYGSYTMTGGGQTTDGSSTTLYAYDQAGQLLSKNASGYNTTTYVYDGMGRVKAASDVNGGTTTYVYNDAATTTTITYASGYVVTQTYNKAGDLISQTDIGANTAGGTTSYAYDKLGRVRVRTDAVGGVKTYYVYDNAGRKVGEVDNAGYVTEYRYDSLNRLIGTIRYRNATAFSLTTLADPDAAVVMSAIRPNAPNAQDMSSWTVYDSEDRVLQTIAGDGSVTTMAYDAAGRLQKTTQFANKLSPSTMAGFFVNPPGAFNLVQNATFDGGVWNWLQWGTANITASAGPVLNNGKVQATFRSSTTTDQFALLVDNDIRSVFPAKRLAVSDQMTVSSGIRLARLTISFLNAEGNIIGDVDLAQFSSFGSGTVNASGFVDIPDGAVTARLIAWVYSSDAALNTDQTIAVGKPMISIAGTSQTGQPAFSATPNGTPNDSVSRNFYDDDGLLIGTMDGEGYLTRNEYDNAGRLVATTAYASATSSASRANGSWTTLLASVGTSLQDRATHLVYDGRGLLRFKVDNLNQVTTYQYVGGIDKQASVQLYTTALPTTNDYTFDNVKRLVFGDANTPAMTAARTSYNVYDTAGRLAYALDAAGSVTGYAYDAMGRATRAVVYATALNVGSQPSFAGMSNWSATNIANTSNRITRTFYTERGEAAYVVDGEGNVRATSYDADGRAVSTTLWNAPVAVNDATTLTGLVSLLPAASSANSVTTSQIYDALGRVADSYDALSNRTHYVYDANGLVLQKTSAYGTTDAVTTAYTYDGMGRVLTQTAAWGTIDAVTTTYTYTAFSQVATETVASNNATYAVTTRYSYDRNGRVLTKVAVDGTSAAVTTAYTYTSFDEVATQTVASGTSDAVTSRFSYDTLGRLVDRTAADGTSAAVTTHYTYTLFGETESETVAYGTADASVTKYAYDKLGRVLTRTDAYGTPEAATTTWTYTALGQVLTETAGDGGVTRYAYDELGRVLTRTDGYGVSGLATTTSYEYTSLGRPWKVTDGLGAITYTWYDKLGRATTVRDALGYLTKTSYDALGNVKSVTRYDTAVSGTAAQGVEPAVTGSASTTIFSYDRLGRLLSTTDALGEIESATYNLLGQKLTATSKLGAVTRYTYDKRGNLTKQVVTASTSNYSGNDNIFNAGVELVTTFNYDLRNNRVSMAEGYAATAAGSPVNLRTTTYVFDKLDRVIKKYNAPLQIVDGTLTAINGVAYTEDYGYDKRSNITRVDKYGWDGVKAYDKVSSFAYYDDLDRKVAEARQSDASAWIYSTFSYDKVGHVVSIKVYENPLTATPAQGGTAPAVPSGAWRQTDAAFDKLGRQTSTTVVSTSADAIVSGNWTGTAYSTNAGAAVSSQGLTASQTYDANGNVVLTTDANGGKVYAWYDALNRKTTQLDAEGYLTTWTYDAEGNAQQETRYATKYAGTVATPGINPPSVTTSTADRVTQFTYDRNGNRLTEKRLNVAAWTVNPDTGAASPASLSYSLVRYTYNALGQVVTKEMGVDEAAAIPTYDATGTAIAAYKYDTLGRLVEQKGAVYTDYLGATVQAITNYSYDALGDLVRTADLASSTPSGNDRATYYRYGAGGRLLSTQDAANNVHTYAYDALQRVRKDSYSRLTSNGTTFVAEYQTTSYDLAGRTLQQEVWSAEQRISLSSYKYNSYGQITEQGQGTDSASGMGAGNALYQVKNKYDGAGRLVATNNGDGILKLLGYDKNGNQTATVSSAGYAFGSDTRLIDALAQTSRTDVNGSYIVYDKRNQATKTVEEGRQLIDTTTANTQAITKAKAYTAFGEVASETDARGNTTDYTYNTMGRVVRRELPSVSWTAENGAVSTGRPTENYYYDLGGRLVGKRDANGNANWLSLLAGTGYDKEEASVVKEIHADGGVRQTLYDVFGDARIVRDELYAYTNMTTANDSLHYEERDYDKRGRLIQVRHNRASDVDLSDASQLNTTRLIDNYTYDLNGNRLTHWNSFLGQGVKETTDYDSLGRVIKAVVLGGDATTYTYAWDGTLQTAGIGALGGWSKSTVNAAGMTMIEKNDVYDRMVDKIDFGGTDYDFVYDAAGRLSQRRNDKGETIVYSWYNIGMQASVVSDDIAKGLFFHGYPLSEQRWHAVSNFRYDADGNRVFESHQVDLTQKTLLGLTTTASMVYQSATVTWDAANRMVSYVDNNTAGSPANIQWEYDLTGNIRRMNSVFRYMDAQGVVSSENSTQDYWYLYDDMNRFITSKGYLSGARGSGAIVAGDTGVEITYDPAGRRRTFTSSESLTKEIWRVTFNGRSYYYYEKDDMSGTWQKINWEYIGKRKEYYDYSDDGYSSVVSISEQKLIISDPTKAPVLSGYGAIAIRSTSQRDLVGRVTVYKEYGAGGYNASVVGENVVYSKAATYNAKGQVTSDVAVSIRSDGRYVNSTSYYYNAAPVSGSAGEWTGTAGAGAYMGGVVTKTVTSITKDNAGQNGNTTTYNYKFWDGAIQSKTNYVSGGDNWTSTFYYDTSGRLTSVYAQDGRPRTISFVNDANGQILQRAEADNRYPSNPRDPDSADYKTTGDPHELHFYFNGLRVGDISNNGTSDVDYATSIASHIATGGTGAFRGGSSSSTSYADFDQSYDPINGLTYESTSSRYTVQSGDTLEAIAQQVWGDVSFWYMIADANGLSASDSLVAGQSLIIPNKVHNAHNNTSTYKVYDPNEAIGDTSPTAARPPKKNGCGVLGAILVVVVAIAVSYFAGPEIIHAAQAVLGGIASSGAVAAGSFGAVAGGIVGGAATGALASVVSQGVGLAVGAQDSFSWKGVALSALGAGISGGLGATGLFGSIAKNGFEVGKLGIKSAFADAMVRSALGSAATQGIGVATHLQDDFDWAGVAGAALGAGLSSQVNVGGFGGNVLRSTAGGLANAASRSVINGTDFGDNIVAALPDMIANTIGNLVADAVAGDGKPRSSSREGSSSGGVTALQDVGPVQVGPIDMSALDDLNFQLVLSGDGGSAIAGGNPLSGPGPGMPDGSGEVGAPIVINADRHQRDMLGALNGTQYRYYESLAGSTNYNELAAWEARSYAPPQAHVRSNFFYDSPLTQSFQTWQRMPWENFSYNGRDYVSMAAAEAGGMPVIRSGPSAYDVYQSQRDKAFIDSIGEGGLGLGPIVYAVGGDPDTIRLSNQLDVAIGGLAVGGALRPGSSVRFSASGRPSVSVLLPVAESEVLNGANFAQKTFKSTFSAEGKFAGRPVSDVAADLNAGRLSPADVPIEYIVRDGNTLILNTRSAQALEQAGIPRGQWNAVNMTGNAQVEARLTGQLSRNRLTSQGTATVRPSNGN